jgi:hypothetical protein
MHVLLLAQVLAAHRDKVAAQEKVKKAGGKAKGASNTVSVTAQAGTRGC